jgi:predicted DCC family thiol-disulfide oxidoreductase YuxK
VTQPATNETPAEMVFYDGYCALCHGAVKFILKRDKTGKAFRFAPLQGETFVALVPAEKRAHVPDSIVVLTARNELLLRSTAFIHILQRLGGIWRIYGGILSAVPRPLRDAGYNLVARVRYRVFGKRDQVCPVMAPELRARFDP